MAISYYFVSRHIERRTRTMWVQQIDALHRRGGNASIEGDRKEVQKITGEYLRVKECGAWEFYMSGRQWKDFVHRDKESEDGK